MTVLVDKGTCHSFATEGLSSQFEIGGMMVAHSILSGGPGFPAASVELTQACCRYLHKLCESSCFYYSNSSEIWSHSLHLLSLLQAKVFEANGFFHLGNLFTKSLDSALPDLLAECCPLRLCSWRLQSLRARMTIVVKVAALSQSHLSLLQ